MTGSAQARLLFPRGLYQPPGACRFSADGLLLASFLGTGGTGATGGSLLDLGCGCGAAAFAALLGGSARTAMGVDMDAALLEAAERNAALLDLTPAFSTLSADLRREEAARRIPAGAFDLACANPPYHRPGLGRLPQRTGRRTARFDEGDTLRHFLRAAHRGLSARGRFALVFPASRLADLLPALQSARLQPRRLRCVHSRGRGPARLVLVEARKGVRPDLTLEPPLVLHEGEGTNTRLTAEALNFCPYLACNDKANA